MSEKKGKPTRFIRKGGRVIPIYEQGKKMENKGNRQVGQANSHAGKAGAKVALGMAAGAALGYAVAKKFKLDVGVSSVVGGLFGGSVFSGDSRRIDAIKREAEINISEGRKLQNYAKLKKKK